MKFVWQEQDIVPGRYVCKPLRPEEKNFTPDGWTGKNTFKIGFDIAFTNVFSEAYPGTSLEPKYCLTCMVDGLVDNHGDKAAIVKFLNDNEMIPMPFAWLLATINYFRDALDWK